MNASSSAGLWDRALQTLKNEIDDESYAAWIEPIQFEHAAEGRLTLTVPSSFHRNWVAWNYQEPITRALHKSAGRDVTVDFVIAPGEEDDRLAADPAVAETLNGPHSSASASQQGRQKIELASYRLNPNYTFDSFVVGESNRFAYAAAQAVADPESRAYNPLFLYGGSGLGKTHLMHAIGQQIRSYGQHLNVLYVSSEAFMNAFIESIRGKDVTQFRNCFRTVDLLLIDDVQFFQGAERSQIEFFHTFNTLFDAGKKIVISSDHPPKELTELEERLRSRFEAGLIVDIQPPDLETRVAILLRKAQAYHLELPPEIAIFIAERVKTNVRKLEGVLKKLAAHCLVTKEAVSMTMAREQLGAFSTGDEPMKISVEKVQLVVCKFFDIHLHDLTGTNRSRKFTGPRQVASYLAREMTDLSFPEIARKFGGRDHTSIIHSHRKVQTELRGDLNRQNLIKYLMKLIKEEPINGVEK